MAINALLTKFKQVITVTVKPTLHKTELENLIQSLWFNN